jgi:hypothetical protein
LEAFEDWGAMSAWMFLQRFPTPQLLEKAGKRQWEKFLHSRKLWRNESGPRRMELFAKATEFCGSEPTVNAKSMLALSLVKMLFALENQLSEYRKRIEELFESHPDHDLFGSLPGAGPKLAPRLLGEIGDDRGRFEGEAQNLQCLAGTAPVTKRSGKHRECHQRWACNKHLRYAVHLFSEHTITRCAWAEIYYKAHRAKEVKFQQRYQMRNRILSKIVPALEFCPFRTSQKCVPLVLQFWGFDSDGILQLFV